MKNRVNKYRELDSLPNGAKTVQQYASERGCNTAYIYKLWKQANDPDVLKDIPFEIVLFKDINFVILSSDKQTVNR
jgi:hypothetical protein